MRYMAQRVLTGEWIDKDLPFSSVERTRELSGPGVITATITPELRTAFHSDGLRILEEWGTFIYAVDDTGRIRNAGVFVDATYDENDLVANCPGFATYPHGYIYGTARNWGPDAGDKTHPAKARPDPLQIVQDLWAYIQEQQDSDLGLDLVGDLSSTVRVGSFEEPYRLRWYEVPDIGGEIDTLAQSTPFDYVESHYWTDDDHETVTHRLRIGWPRLGKTRDDLRFALGENVTITPAAASSGGTFANDIFGVGNGEGASMVLSRATKRDGRLRRTRVVTDKTKGQPGMDTLVSSTLEKTSTGLDVTSFNIIDHPNARISAIDLGDDILIQSPVPSYSEDTLRMRVRVLSITEGDSDEEATLTTSRSANFIYSSTTEVSDGSGG